MSTPAATSAPRARRAARGVLTALLAVPVAGLLAVGALAAAGYHPMVERSDSMAPAMRAGDLLFAKTIPASEARPGDVVTFADPAVEGRTITHRVRSLHRRPDGRLAFVTQGDANSASERWTAPAEATVGRHAFRAPAVGRLLGSVRREIWGAVIVLAGSAIFFGFLRSLWTEPRPVPEAAG